MVEHITSLQIQNLLAIWYDQHQPTIEVHLAAAINVPSADTLLRQNHESDVGIGADSYHIASDVLGFVEKTDDAVYVENGHFLQLMASNVV